MCEVLEIHRSTYYKYLNFKDPDYPDYAVMKETFNHHKKTLGYRRLSAVLRDQYGWVINAKKVLRIMRKFGLRAKYIRDLRPNYSKKRIVENLQADQIKRNFNQAGWVTDITYLTLYRNGPRAYLSTILDLETRQWVAYKISPKNDFDLVIDTLKDALNVSQEKDLNGLILHSDQGFQYLSTEYQQICLSHGIVISHSRKSNPLR
jgi:transposase InsO family protein